MARMERRSSCESLRHVVARWERSPLRPADGLLGNLVGDLELPLLELFCARDLAKLNMVSRAFRELSTLACRERLKVLVGRPAGDEELESAEMVRHFLETKGTGLPRLLHMVTHCRSQLERPTVACGEAHSCALKAGPNGRGEVFTFGDGRHGQLGCAQSEAPTPVRVELSKLLGSREVIAVSCGARHTCLLTEDGRLVVFGENNAGQLGVGPREKRHEPKLVRDRLCKGGPRLVFTQVVSGRAFTAALLSTGRVAIFGDGLAAEREPNGLLLVRGEMRPDERVVMMSTGHEHLLMLTDQNRLFAVGHGRQGKLGIARNLEPSPAEEALPEAERRLVESMRLNAGASQPALVAVHDPEARIMQIAAGGNHSAYVTGDGQVYTWGSCASGELGIGRYTRAVPRPTRVPLPAQSPYALHVACGKSHTAVLTTCGRILTCGNGVYRQDGKASRFWATNAPQDICLGDLAGNTADTALVVCGDRHTCTVDVGGSLYSFGDPLCSGRATIVGPGEAHVPRRLHLGAQDKVAARRRFCSA